MPTYYGVSVDTRMALGEGDGGPHHTERGDHAPTGPNVYEALGLWPHLRVSYLSQRRCLLAPSGYSQTPHTSM